MKISLSFICLTLIVFFSACKTLHAESLDLYIGEVPVMDKSAKEQARAMPMAMEQVLRKLSGLRNFDEYPDLEDALRRARSMAITFYYRNRQSVLPDGEEIEELRFFADFSPAAIDGLMQDMQLPIWKPERRPLAIWFVVDDGFSRQIMPIELEYAWDSISELAKERGMPIFRPRPDADGVYPVDIQLVWGGYTEDLVESGRTDVLVIAGRREGPEWNLRMNLDYIGQLRTWRNRNTDLQVAIIEGMNMAVDEIAALNSIAPSDQGQWNFEIMVSGLVESGDYIRCLSYLQNVSLVERVEVRRASPGRVRFDLGLNALPDYFLSALSADGVLGESETQGEYELTK